MNKFYYYNMFSPAMNIFSRGELSFSRLKKLYFFSYFISCFSYRFFTSYF